ncbi:molybdenum cofactor guanylyltransferase [Actinokineospora enzanensis]|uniref:molybdenum cofactor guanylyltransferase n=1 Tax=Actinokineospora enzanensis TaxID=155975 RepID=UPI0003822CF7|nr:NTP transferase domain-containing protein [Actinokineospora enzanensis]
MPPWSAIVLAGGKATRLGGIDKPALIVNGTPMLDRALQAATGATEITVVGPRRRTTTHVRWIREHPQGSGPLAALAAGLATITTPTVAVLAADLPQVTRGTVERLVDAVKETGAVLIDQEARPQWLLSAWRTTVLSEHMPERPEGMSLHRVLSGLSPVQVQDVDGSAHDIDVPSDLEAFPD